ncbi:MAG: YCF48-related protein [FCB group bacterium]|jgi:photosystem II stability/assembly factor-like uncharacterized protein
MKTFITLFVLFFATSYCFSQGGWVLQNTGTNCDIYCITCIDNQNCWAIGKGNVNDIPHNDSTVILHTFNGGLTWETQLNIPGTYPYDISFYDKNNGCFGGDPYSYYTTNGGIKWFPIDTVFDKILYKVKYVNEHTIWAICNYNQRDILFSTDNGKKWNKSLAELSFDCIYFLDSLNGWAVGNDASDYQTGLFHTSDGGKNWFVIYKQVNLMYGAIDIAFIDKNIGWISLYGSDLLYSTDGGNAWNVKTIDTTRNFNLHQVIFTDDNHGWTLGINYKTDSTSTLFKTTNSGMSWVQDNDFPVDSIKAIAFPDAMNKWAVGKHGHIWHTTK